MSLQFVLGGSGSGKSRYAYTQMIRLGLENPSSQYYLVVPEQFTMQSQKDLVDLSPGGGILNIDVLSFQRLAYRVFEEVGGDLGTVLEDIGKMLVLQKLILADQKNLPYLGREARQPGTIDEMKSLISEFLQYKLGPQEVEQMAALAPEDSLLSLKLKDISRVYASFQNYMEKNGFLSAEELLGLLAKALPLSKKVAHSYLVFDGFTGFTPVQLRVVEELLLLCDQVVVVVTIDPKAKLGGVAKDHQLFYMSQQMLYETRRLAAKNQIPIREEHLVLHEDNGGGRFASSPALAFLERNLFRYRRETYPENPVGEISLSYGETPAQEMDEVAREIRRLIREEGYAYGEIAVITGNLPEYESVARERFGRLGIPYFIDTKHNVLMNPFVELLRSGLELLTRDYTYESVFRFLRCGMLGFSREEVDRLENYCLARGIKGYAKWKKPFRARYRGQSQEDLEVAEATRSAFLEKITPLHTSLLKKGNTVKEDCIALYQFLVDQQIQQQLKKMELSFKDQGRHSLEKECAQIYALVIGFLEKLVGILGEESITPYEFAQLMETGLQKMEIGLIPAGQDQVLVGDMERTRVKDIRALFFVGMNEGSIPKNTDTGGFLTELDRDFFEERNISLAPDAKKRITIGKFYLYLNMTKPSQRLYLSYALSSEGGQALRPAYLVGNLRDLFPALPLQKVSLSEGFESPLAGRDYLCSRLDDPQALLDPLFRETYGYLLRDESLREETLALIGYAFQSAPRDLIGQAVARAIYGEDTVLSATRLERYCACAFQHFLSYGLRLSERPLYEFQFMDMGNLLHASLEAFEKTLEEQGLSWAELSDEDRDALVEDCVHDQVQGDAFAVLYEDARGEAMIERTKRLLKRTVWMLSQQLKNGEFVPMAAELSFEGGRVDRLDICKEGDTVYVKIIDYKSGNTSFNLGNVYYGLQLQLMVYLSEGMRVAGETYEGCRIVPAGVFYCNIKDPIISAPKNPTPEAIREALFKELKCNGLVLNSSSVFEKLDQTLQTIPVNLNKDGTPSADSFVASLEQFDLLGAYVQKKIQESAREIYQGSALAIPYKKGKRTACDSCSFRDACCRDERIPGTQGKKWKSMKKQEVWELIGKNLKGEAKEEEEVEEVEDVEGGEL